MRDEWLVICRGWNYENEHGWKESGGESSRQDLISLAWLGADGGSACGQHVATSSGPAGFRSLADRARSRESTSAKVRGFTNYSVRSACITSTREARAAGSTDAITAATSSTSAEAITGNASGIRISSKLLRARVAKP